MNKNMFLINFINIVKCFVNYWKRNSCEFYANNEFYANTAVHVENTLTYNYMRNIINEWDNND